MVSLYPLYIFLVLLLIILPSLNEYEKRDISFFNVNISSLPLTSIIASSLRESYSFSISTNLPSPKSTGVSPRTHLPLPKGGTAAIPGPFGSGKCVQEYLPERIYRYQTDLVWLQYLPLQRGKMYQELFDLSQGVYLEEVSFYMVLVF